MACFLDAEDALDPGDYFVGGRVDGFVQVDAAAFDVVFDWTAEWG